MIRKTLLTLVLTAGMVGGSAGIASAHECYVAKRSAQGDAGAAKSAQWETVALSDLFASAHRFLGGRALTVTEVQTAVQRATAAGVPLTFTTFDGMLPGYLERDHEATSAKSSDGKGVDHFITAYGQTIAGIYFDLASGPV